MKKARIYSKVRGLSSLTGRVAVGEASKESCRRQPCGNPSFGRGNMTTELDALISEEVKDLRLWANVAGVAVEVFKTEPTQESLLAMRGVVEASRSWVEVTQNENLKKGFAYLDRFFSSAEQADDLYRFIELLEVEFASMFYGIGEDPVFLVESVHRGTEHTLYEKPYFEVEAVYEAWGYNGLPDCKEPFDHICQELSFLMARVDNAANSLEKFDNANYQTQFKAAIEFIEDHFAKWVPQIAQDLLSHRCSGYYKAGARLLLGLQEVLLSYVASEFVCEVDAESEMR